MNQLEKVKGILDSELVKMYPSMVDAKREIRKRNAVLAQQICQLEPKPDLLTDDHAETVRKHMADFVDEAINKEKPDRLLTDEIRDIARNMITASHYNNLPDSKFDNCLNSIIAKTASIKDAECQQRVGRIFGEIETQNPVDEILGGVILTPSQWQALKKQEGVK